MFAVRLTDPSLHGGTLLPPVAFNVLAGGLPLAFMGSLQLCPGPFHLPGPLMATGARVLVNGLPAGRLFDLTPCGAPVSGGEPTILIGG